MTQQAKDTNLAESETGIPTPPIRIVTQQAKETKSETDVQTPPFRIGCWTACQRQSERPWVQKILFSVIEGLVRVVEGPGWRQRLQETRDCGYSPMFARCQMHWNAVSVFHEVGSGNHESITAAAEVGCILELFGKNITSVDEAGDVSDFDDACVMVFADTIFMEVDVFCAFVGDGGGPVNTRFVIVVNGHAIVSVVHVKVVCPVKNMLEFGDAFTGGYDFGFTRAEGGTVLPD